jgi:hypothetical protein
MAARRSVGWDAGGWRGSSLGASTGRCGAAGAPSWGQEALYRRVDGEAERAAELELRRRCAPAIPVKETEIGSLGELRWVVGGAVCASNREWGAAVAAVDDGQWWWRRSGEGGELGEEGMLWPGVLGGVKQFAEQQLSTP